MTTMDTILEELKNVPADKLEDLYSIIHSLQTNTLSSDAMRRNILSFSGSFADMSNNDYNDFLLHTNETRTRLFDRDITL